MAFRYLLDENVDTAYSEQLPHHDPALVVRKIGDPDAPPRRTKDPDILAWCEEMSVFLVTNDRSTMPPHVAAHLATGRHVPGVFILDDDLGIGGNIDQLVLIAGASSEDEWRDRIVYLPVT